MRPRTSTLGVLVGAAAAALVPSGAALALVVPGLVHSASVNLSSPRAGAAPVALTVRLEYEMQCGYPGPGPVVITLPAAERVPRSLSRSDVLVGGRPAPSVTVSGNRVSVGLPPEPRVMCDVIGPGRLTIAFTSAAGLGNPSRPGSYMVEAARGPASFSAAFTTEAG